jgi:hypothetical protein
MRAQNVVGYLKAIGDSIAERVKVKAVVRDEAEGSDFVQSKMVLEAGE